MVEVRVADIEASLSWDDWERWVQQGRVPPDAQVRFEPVTGNDWVRADAMESYADLVAAGARSRSVTAQSAVPPILTALLVGVQVRIWWWTGSTTIRRWVVEDGVNFAPPYWEDAQGWRLLTSGFLHLDLGHILLNMLWLAYAGSAIERTLGRLNLLTLYVGSVMGGAVLSMLLRPETSSIGASGGVFGLIAAVTVFGFTHPDALPRSVRRFFGMAMLPYLVLMFASGLTSPNTDNWAHFGGLATGALLVVLLRAPGAPGARRRSRVVAAAVALATLALSVLPIRLGPLLEPIDDHLTVRNNAPGTTVPVERDIYEEVTWDAPVGWRARGLSSGPLGLASPSPPAQSRAVGVQLRETDTPLTADDLLGRFVETVRGSSPLSEVLQSEREPFAGTEGMRARLLVGDRVVHWVGATRGLQTLEWVWEVDVSDEDHLAPLRERLLDSVQWRPPYELIDAQERVARVPSSALAQRDLARAESRTGDAEAAVARLRELARTRPTDVETWEVLFSVLRTWPGAVTDEDALFNEALAAIPTAAMAAMVADELVALDRTTEALGLLELAWLQAPQNRPVRRALRRLERPTRIDLERMTPAWRLADERGVRDPEVQVAEPTFPLTLAQGLAEGTRIERLEAVQCATLAQQLPYMSVETAAERLVALQQGVLPEPVETADYERLSQQLVRIDEGRPPRWMCEPLTQALAGHPVVAWTHDAASDEVVPDEP